jgi:hypothetical protein
MLGGMYALENCHQITREVEVGASQTLENLAIGILCATGSTTTTSGRSS